MDPKARLIGASVLAVAGVGVAGWLATRSLGVGRTVRSASQAAAEQDRAAHEADAPDGGGTQREIKLDGPPPAWVQARQETMSTYNSELDYPSKGDAIDSFDSGVGDLSIAAEQDGALGALGLPARRSLIESYRTFMRPLVAADQAAFEQAVADLGGETGSGAAGDTPAAALFGRLSGYLENSRVALSSARVTPRDGTNPQEVPAGPPPMAVGKGKSKTGVVAIPMMVGVEKQIDDEGKAVTTRDLAVPLSALFPDAAALAAGGAQTIEVWAPAKLADTGGKKADFGPSVYFVHDAGRGTWQPVAMRVTLVSDKAAAKLDEMMKAARKRSVQD
ncbi:MAG: hypothetical protein H6810_05240 [Phycisphaeraceae bacterium]|nr:MAG: hypothetical protein H6810_05240 [Phycisphaeraceae bacterium]